MDRHATGVLRQRMTPPAARRPENDLVLRALRGETTPRTPVWLMRQAGRFDPEYRELRAQAGLELEELFADPRCAAEITLLPVRFGVDAAILFQDILTILGPMGAPFIFRPGPMAEHPVATADDADRLEMYDPAERLGFVFESIELALEKLQDRIPLIGFAGAPLTLLSFLVSGGSPGRDSGPLLAFLTAHKRAADSLLARLADVTAAYLRLKIRAGAHAVQLFESSASLLDEGAYRRWALPSQQRIFKALEAEAAPRILFARETPPHLMAMSGADAISIGSTHTLEAARAETPRGGIQGNLDNELLLYGSPDDVRAAAEACVRAGGHRGHVLNLGHGVLKSTPVENVRRMIETAHQIRCEEGESG